MFSSKSWDELFAWRACLHASTNCGSKWLTASKKGENCTRFSAFLAMFWLFLPSSSEKPKLESSEWVAGESGFSGSNHRPFFSSRYDCSSGSRSARLRRLSVVSFLMRYCRVRSPSLRIWVKPGYSLQNELVCLAEPLEQADQQLLDSLVDRVGHVELQQVPVSARGQPLHRRHERGEVAVRAVLEEGPLRVRQARVQRSAGGRDRLEEHQALDQRAELQAVRGPFLARELFQQQRLGGRVRSGVACRVETQELGELPVFVEEQVQERASVEGAGFALEHFFKAGPPRVCGASREYGYVALVGCRGSGLLGVYEARDHGLPAGLLLVRRLDAGELVPGHASSLHRGEHEVLLGLVGAGRQLSRVQKRRGGRQLRAAAPLLGLDHEVVARALGRPLGARGRGLVELLGNGVLLALCSSLRLLSQARVPFSGRPGLGGTVVRAPRRCGAGLRSGRTGRPLRRSAGAG